MSMPRSTNPRGRRRPRLTPAVAVGVVVVLVASLAGPAFGGPSPLSVAKRALSTAKRADKRAKSALTEARKTPSLSIRLVDGPDVSAPPGDFARTRVDCPPGYRATGMALSIGALNVVAALSFGTGYLGSAYNSSSNQAFSWSLDVNCAGGAQKLGVVASRRARQRAEQRLRSAEEAFLEGRRMRLVR